MADRVGQQLGNYRLVRLIGQGGFAEVYLGEHVHLGTQAAIKVLHAPLATPQETEQFRTEARTIAALIHPNILRVLDFGVEGTTPFLVLDYAPHESLRARLPSHTPLPLATVVPLVRQVAEALHYAHEQKLVHRDIKPENMLLGRSNEVLLSDFGIAIAVQSTSMQQTQGVAGTAAYMAPEQLQGKPRPSSDLYSLGVVVYEWLTGERPFQGGFTEVASQHLFTLPPPLREKVPSISPVVEQIVLTALAKDPKARFGNARAFAAALEQAARSEGAGATYQTAPDQLATRLPTPGSQPVSAPPAAGQPLPPVPGGLTPSILYSPTQLTPPASPGGYAPPSAATPNLPPNSTPQLQITPGGPGTPPQGTPLPNTSPAWFNPALGAAQTVRSSPPGADAPPQQPGLTFEQARLAGRDGPPVGWPPVAPPAGVGYPGYPVAPTPAAPGRRRNTIIIGLLIVVLLAAAGGGLAFFLNNGKGNAPITGGSTATSRSGPNPTATPSGPPLIYTYQPPTHSGGTIIYGDWQFPTSTNPWFNSSTVGTELSDALYGQPLVVTPDGKFLPDELAEIPTVQNGDISPDGLTVVLKLNHNLKWSDGQPLTASDFIYWIKVVLDPASGVGSQYGFTPDVLASYTGADPYTVVLKYAHVFASFLFNLPLAAPEHAWGSIADSQLQNTPSVNLIPTVTSGPFVVSDYASGQSFTMTPNLHYVSTSLHATVLDRLIFKGYPSKDALIAGYQASEVDHAEDFSLADIQKLTNLPGLHIAPAIAYEHLDFNLSNPVLTFNVRKAIEQAIDRCTLIQTLLHAACNTLIDDSVEPPPHPDADPTIKEYPFNVNAAKADLQADGWNCSSGTCTKNGQAFPALNLVTTSGNALRANVTQVIQQDLAAIGIPVNLNGQYYPAGVLFGDYSGGGILATGRYDLSLFAYVQGLDTYGNLYSSFDSSQIPSASNPSGGNFERVSDPMVDQLLQQGNSTIDQTARTKIYQQLLKYITTQVYTMPLYLRPNITLTDNKIGDYFDNPLFWQQGGNEWDIGEWFVRG